MNFKRNDRRELKIISIHTKYIFMKFEFRGFGIILRLILISIFQIDVLWDVNDKDKEQKRTVIL